MRIASQTSTERGTRSPRRRGTAPDYCSSAASPCTVQRRVTCREFYEFAGIGLARRIRVISVPYWLARSTLRIAKRTLRLLSGGRMNVVTSASLDFMTRDNPFSSDRARRELGWKPQLRPEVAVPDAFRWWRDHR